MVLNYIMAERTKKLRKLDLRYCPKITDEGIKHFAENRTELKELNIKGCYHITDKGIKTLLGCQNLKNLTLEVRGCKIICDDGLNITYIRINIR